MAPLLLPYTPLYHITKGKSSAKQLVGHHDLPRV
jgi:hypothetical protein